MQQDIAMVLLRSNAGQDFGRNLVLGDILNQSSQEAHTVLFLER